MKEREKKNKDREGGWEGAREERKEGEGEREGKDLNISLLYMWKTKEIFLYCFQGMPGSN